MREALVARKRLIGSQALRRGRLRRAGRRAFWRLSENPAG
jgi:hypothetical protein